MFKVIKKKRLRELAERLESGNYVLKCQDQEINLTPECRKSGGQGLIYVNKNVVVKIVPITEITEPLNEGLERVALFPNKRNKSGLFVFRQNGTEQYCPLTYQEMNNFHSSVAEEDIGSRCSDLEQSVDVINQDFYAITDEKGSEALAFTFLELIPDPTLDELIEEGIDSKMALTIIANLGKAITEMKQRGYVHRDIKPGNIMVNRNTGKVKIIDFGLAKDLKREEIETESICGTPHYMPPESAAERLHKNSDLYSLGVIAYEMLTGTFPPQKQTDDLLHLTLHLYTLYRNEDYAQKEYRQTIKDLIAKDYPLELAESVAAAMYGNPELRGTDLPKVAYEYIDKIENEKISRQVLAEEITKPGLPKTEKDLTKQRILTERLTTNEKLTIKESQC